MARISYYRINVNFSTGELMSLVTNTTRITFLSESLKEINNTYVTLQHEPFSYIITILTFNIKGMSSQPTLETFGMKICTCTAVYCI